VPRTLPSRRAARMTVTCSLPSAAATGSTAHTPGGIGADSVTTTPPTMPLKTAPAALPPGRIKPADRIPETTGDLPLPPNSPLEQVPGPASTIQDIRNPDRWRSFPIGYVRFIAQKLSERPLKFEAWERNLLDDPDREFLLHMVRHGLSLTSVYTQLQPFDCKNYKSAYTNVVMVDEALAPYLEAGRLFIPPLGITSQYVHALGAVLKTATLVRVIHDHLRPYGSALNESLSQTSFSFASVDDTIKLMTQGGYMAKVDIEAAYRHVPIDPADWDKLAFRWPDTRLLFDGYMLFGLKYACEILTALARRWCA
jgi:hypothetical protein